MVDGFLPFVEVGIAQSSIQIGEVAGVGAAVVAGDFQETGIVRAVAVERLVELLHVEILLSAGECRAGLFLTRASVCLVSENTCDDGEKRNRCDDDGLLVLDDEGFRLVKGLVHVENFLLIFLVCHYF